ncbi:aminotransferase class V-fold PLP-dependent enzyme [Blattabacterium cuenoti]|nr:SufS family cysteine desulfurase [Blattabacterium cuenoti]
MFSQKKIKEIRDQFPILKTKINDNSLVYIDNAATTQKPIKVIQTANEFYIKQNSNIHRGVHFLSRQATEKVEFVRKQIQKMIHAKLSSEIIFTKGATESINLIAYSIEPLIKKGDEIIISYMEHHSNIIPWKILCDRKQATLKIIPINKNGLLELEYFESIISYKTKLVSITHLSNVLGIINPVKDIIKKSHKYGSMVLIDGAQVPSNLDIDVQDLNVDFYVFSAHKMYGPTGIGILYGKKDILDTIPPYQSGGEMIKYASFKKCNYSDLPFKFEAGTPNIEGIVVWGSAIDFVQELGIKNIQLYKKELLIYAIKRLNSIDGIHLYGGGMNNIDVKSSIISFNLDRLHYFDVGMILDKLGIAVRTGTLCAQPLINFFNVEGMIRVSFSIYNTFQEVDYLYECLIKAKNMLFKSVIL